MPLERQLSIRGFDLGAAGFARFQPEDLVEVAVSLAAATSPARVELVQYT